MTFPAQLINTTAPPKAVKLTNEGTSALSISSLKSSGEFQIASTCGNSVPAGASCTISAVFEPKSAGTQTGLVTLVDSASAEPQVIELSGRGTIAKVLPVSLKFGSQKVGSKSAPEAVALTNEGSTSMSFESIAVGGEFSTNPMIAIGGGGWG